MNNKKLKLDKAVDFQEYLAEQLKIPEFKKYYDIYGKQLEVAYNVLQLRKRKKMSQAELARKLDTTQSVVARMESGQQNFTTDTLQKIASVFDCNLQIRFIEDKVSSRS